MDIDAILVGMPEAYRALRGDLFNGFLSLGGFLLSMLAFIVVMVKQQIYDVPSYQDERGGKSGVRPVEEIYKPLRWFAGFLIAAIACSLVTAGIHFVAGFIASRDGWFWPILGFISSIISLMLLACSLVFCAHNLQSIYVQGERDCRRRRRQEEEARLAKKAEHGCGCPCCKE